MAERKQVLILGGTGDALALAGALSGHPRVATTTSLAGRTSAPAPPAGALRFGGFGGVSGLTAFLRDAAIDLVIDATHPFAAQMSGHAVAACEAAERPLLRLSRPPWQPQPGDNWIPVADLAAAAVVVAERGQRVFLTTGARDLAAFAELESVWFLVRLIEPPAEPLPLGQHRLILARGPFSEADEAALLREQSIDLLVSKNSGGPATAGKLAAARRLRIPVAMVERPVLPPCEEVCDLDAALAWVEARMSA